ncbi:MAG TPA: hypothetical protein VIR32_10145 [Lachnospiraceae bacterium]
MKAITKIYLLDENHEKFFGEGPYLLLQEIEKRGSLRSAAMSMGMAYSKALKMITHAEKVLGFALTSRQSGGYAGGGSKLTKEGKEWVEKYGAYREACMEANQKLYLEFFSSK